MPGGQSIDGRMLNCCAAGCYAELKAPVKAGTILVVRTTGGAWGGFTHEGLRSMALAEVRWSEPISIEGTICYATGLKYVIAY